MSESVLVRLDLPKDWKKFKLPRALDERLQELLEKQDCERKLSARERREAEALVELVDVLSLLKLRAAVAKKSGGK